jgi:sulfonate dioxygenase
MAPSATETIATPVPSVVTLRLLSDNHGDYKELAPTTYEKAAEEGKVDGFQAAKVCHWLD